MVDPNVPPHDLEAERSMLGACMHNNDVLADIEPIASPADCYHPAHAVIYEAILTVTRRGEPADVVTVAAELRKQKQLTACGDGQYLSELGDRISTTAWASHHARIVARLARKRRIVTAATQIAGRAMQHGTTDDEDAEFAASTLEHASEKRDDGDAVPLQTAMDEAMNLAMGALEDGKKTTGIETGFADYDRLTAGLHPGQLIVIAGRPAMGKTSVAMNIATHVARHTGPVLVFSLEMPRIELAQRFLSGESRVDQSRIRALQLGREEVQSLAKAASVNWDLPMFIDDRGGANIHTIRAGARRMARKKGLSLIVIDYLQLMEGTGRNESNREQEVSGISRGLKALAKDLGVPVIALSQLNRGPEDRNKKDHRPRLSDLRESGAIEQDADNVTFVYRDEIYDRQTEDRGIAELIIAKQRNGPTETTRLRFIRELTKFESLAAAPRGVSVDDMRMAAGADNDF